MVININWQRQFNFQAARIRQEVERAIGASGIKWRIQQGKENRIAALAGPEFAAKCTRGGSDTTVSRTISKTNHRFMLGS